MTSSVGVARTPHRDHAASLPRLVALPTAIDVPRRAFVAQIMGLPMSVHVRGPHANDPDAAEAVDIAFAELRADDRLFSTYRGDSAVSRIRRGELRMSGAGPRVAEVAALCEAASERTGGAFSAWLPGPDGRPSFDPTGLVKGWAVSQAFECLVRRLDSLEAHDVLMSAGGDIVVACARTDTPDWSIGIEDPCDRSRLLMSVPLRRGAVATSGVAARGAHIVDPATGRPPAGLLSATVVGPSLTWADVYATAAFVMGGRAEAWISTLADHAGVLVDTSGQVHTPYGASHL